MIKTIFSKETLTYLEETEEKQMKNNNNLYSQTANITDTQNNLVSDYDFYNINTSIPLRLMEIPSGSNFSSNNTCVTFPELRMYNYTVVFTNFDYKGKVFPENFCYGALTYNISRNDFFNMVEKNKSKINNYFYQDKFNKQFTIFSRCFSEFPEAQFIAISSLLFKFI
jgi:hypothetical protein